MLPVLLFEKENAKCVNVMYVKPLLFIGYRTVLKMFQAKVKTENDFFFHLTHIRAD